MKPSGPENKNSNESDAIDTRGALLDTSSSKNRKRHRDPNPDPNTRKQMKPSGPENKNSNPNPVYFRPIRKSEAEDTIDDIKEALDVPIEIANIIYTYTPPPPPKIQFWNGYPGRATLRSQDHEIYMLGANGPLGPLGITDEKGSYSLSRKLIGRVSEMAALLEYSLEPSGLSLMGIRETLILTELKDGKVTSWEVAEHENSKDYHFDHKKYREERFQQRIEDISRDLPYQKCPDFTRAHHQILPLGNIVPTPLKDQEGKIVEDAETVVAANWYVLVLTRSGDLYFNQHLYMKNVQSIVQAETDGFVLILNKNHIHEFHSITRLIREYLQDPENRGSKEDIQKLKMNSYEFGLRDSSLPAIGHSVYSENLSGRLGLKTDGRLESYYPIPSELKTYLTDRSNYVKSVAASSLYHVALLQLGNGSQEVYVWKSHLEISGKVDFNRFPCLQKGNPGDGKPERKRIVGITASDNEHYRRGHYNDFMKVYLRVDYRNMIALNLEDNSSCLLLISRGNLSFLGSFPEHTRSIYNIADGMLIVTDSRIFKITEPGQVPEIVADSDRRYVSFVASSDGYVIVYPDGKYDVSESVQPPTDIEDKIRRGGGIAEIYHDRSGTFHAILRDGRIASWYSETSVVFRNTPDWDMDESLVLR